MMKVEVESVSTSGRIHINTRSTQFRIPSELRFTWVLWSLEC